MAEDTAARAKRPSGTEVRQRSAVIGFRADACERAQLNALAVREGLTLSSYVRARALSEPRKRTVRRPTVERADLSKILAQLGKCGSNANQIARVLNSGGDVPADIIDATLADIRTACRFIMERMGKRPESAE